MTFSIESKQELKKALDKHHINYIEGPWSNYMGNVQHSDAIIIQIDSESQVVNAISALNTINKKHPETKITARGGAGWSTKRFLSTFFPSMADPLEKYDASYSFSEVVKADVIFQFTPKFQSHIKFGAKVPPRRPGNPADPIGALNGREVTVPAGMQLDKLAKLLQKENLSLPTAAMIKYVTAVGLCGTGGHGTGRYEPAFSGLIRQVKVCDHEGKMRTITHTDKDFATLFGAHAGLPGIITEITLLAVEKFNLEEKIKRYSEPEKLKEELPALMRENQYFTVMSIPTYDTKPHYGTCKWQIRLWNYSTYEAQHNTPIKEELHEFIDQAVQEGGVKVGGDAIQNLLCLHHPDLLPYYTRFANLFNTLSRGDRPKVDIERFITHYHTAFPRNMHDVSWIIPVKDTEAGEVLAMVLEKIDNLLNEANERGERPITYAVYARYFKGTNGGLSTSATNENDECVVAIDTVTNPNAPGITAFEINLREFLESNDLKPRFHLGKHLPHGVNDYKYFYDEKTLAEFEQAQIRWHGSENAYKNSPFLTPFMETMLGMKHAEPKLQQIPVRSFTQKESSDVLNALVKCIQVMETVLPGISKYDVVKELCAKCNEKINTSERKLETEVSLSLN